MLSGNSKVNGERARYQGHLKRENSATKEYQKGFQTKILCK
jgi:hypothetical protein